ncbi:mercuric reductase [Youhaiella tibetensis]|uniref:FAD-containing oxidoreductase n=1 Tax=Paradevosia tibetensis TaxID=1447062 RepID=A0A5B9DRJ1_9HYPH|nr:FAD-containing oxidoreductase [Youhaiella tibetensis]QEE20994.1 FAD-containing oxidoreductase [Youhaiella tibetensis]GGF19152.1 mercuric reductase [Youhaiella tibetensis]
MAEQVDAIVIGGGQAGPFLAVRLAQAGMKTVIIERSHMGGTCVNNGCMPTKTMVASARVAHMARRASEYGVSVGGAVSVDMKAVKARKDKIVETSAKGLVDWIEGTENLELVWETARFSGPREITAGDRVFAAPRIFINTGGRPVVPDWPGLAGIPYLTNESIMDLDVLPEHLIIVGGSYIGLEFAQMFARFGSRVTVIEHGDRLIGREDPDVSDTIRQVLEGEGIAIHLNARDIAVSAMEGGGVKLNANAGGMSMTAEGSHLLLAIGRVPNVEALDLPSEVVTNERGYIKVDDQLRTSAEGIWAMGDVTGHGAFTHTSYNDFEVVAGNLLDNDPRRVSDRIDTYALFVDPPLGRVGMSEAEARKSGRRVLAGKMPMTRVGRAKEKGETQGFMKVLVDADSEQFLGAAFLCTEGDEIVHTILDAMAGKVPYTVIKRAMHIHPTVSELIPTMLQELKPLE